MTNKYFKTWCIETYSHKGSRGIVYDDSPEGDFVYDMTRDKNFPCTRNYKVIRDYLDSITYMCEGAWGAFRNLWKEYSKAREE